MQPFHPLIPTDRATDRPDDLRRAATRHRLARQAANARRRVG